MGTNQLVTSITVGVIALNEHDYLPRLLKDLIAQDYPKEKTQLILVDGMSSDDTRSMMEEFKNLHISEYSDILVLDNPKVIQSSGWNIVIQNATADAIYRIDAHAQLPSDYLSACVTCLNSGEDVCGGPRENIIDGETPFKMMLLDAEKSMFGSGIASYRQETEERKYVDSVFHGAYRKEVFEKVGLFNEKLLRTEDNEMHYRIREAGYNICYDPSIHSCYQTRNTLKRMLKQKYLNGRWVGKTFFVCPKCLSIFHLVPAAFVLGLIFTTILALFGVWQLLAIYMALYGAFLLLTTIMSLIKTHNLFDILLPVVIFLIHVSYGFGTLLCPFGIGRIKKDD